MTSSLHEQIRDFILENYLFTRDPLAVGFDDSLTARGITDSSRMLELVLFVEDKLGVKVRDEEIVPENFDSINRIASFVSARRST
jgi:acyl carrier protein